MDDQRRRLLEEERDFLLRSIEDLDREHAAGDVDEADYRTLRDDYTARAAATLRALESGPRPRPGDGRLRSGAVDQTLESGARPRLVARSLRWRTAAWIGVVAVIAGASGVLVAQSSGSRSGGDPLTGLDVRGESTLLAGCNELDASGDVDGALACYDDLVATGTENHQVFVGRGWLQVRTGIQAARADGEADDDSGDDSVPGEDDAAGLIAAGIDDLTEAAALAPRASEPFLFRAIGRFRGTPPDPIGALGDLVAWDENGPSEQERTIAAALVPAVLDAAIDSCIALDVSGRGGTEVLQCYTDALRLDSQHPLANVYLGFLLGKAGETGLALEHLDRGLAADPDATQGYVFRAAVHAAAGDLEAARADLERFDSFPDTPEDQRAAASQVRAAVDAGRSPFG